MQKGQKLLLGRRAVVLLVEDGENDVELTKLAFERGEFAVDLHVTRDGEHGMAFLRKQAGVGDCPTPDIVLLDLHLPKMGGLEVLEAISADARLKQIPVIVLTTSRSEREILQAYQQGCRGYLFKPLGFAEFANAIQGIEDYWFTLITLPAR